MQTIDAAPRSGSLRGAIALLCIVSSPLSAQTQLTSRTKEVKIDNGSVLKVEAGELQVPESRRRPTERRVTIP
jgi:hypothetical protein